MERSRRELIALTAGTVSLATLAGCLGDDADDDADDNGQTDGMDDGGDDGGENNGDVPDALDLETFEIVDRDADAVTAYVHGDHWHGDPIEIPEGDRRSLGAIVEDESGEPVELADGYELTVAVVEGAPEIVDVDLHGDHVHVTGTETGLTDLVFTIEYDGETLYETPTLQTDVGDHDDHGDGQPAEFQLLDRDPDPHEVVATYHDDHWHGEDDIPTIPVGETLSLGGTFLDGDENEIPIGTGESYELAVQLAEDAEEGVVSIDPDEHWHGDHVHLYGEAAGETTVVFSLWHDDHADWETAPVTVVVE